MNGILLIDKEPGWTSHDVVAKLRGVLRERRIGHSGTLDPMATGLLVVFLGRATRAVQFAEADVKEYEAALRLGITTDTQDSTGTVLETAEADISEAQLLKVLADFRGELMQLPPMYSAIKVGGKKLYELARKGQTAQRELRSVTIEKLALSGKSGDDWLLSVRCSKGTYIRTLCHDIGQALGCGAVMSGLRRTVAGAFSVSDAHTLDQITEIAAGGGIEELLIPLDRLFCAHPALTLDEGKEKKCRNGMAVALEAPEGTYRVYSRTGEFLMLGRISQGRLQTVKNFFEVG